jgi:hypothetical protein
MRPRAHHFHPGERSQRRRLLNRDIEWDEFEIIFFGLPDNNDKPPAAPAGSTPAPRP